MGRASQNIPEKSFMPGNVSLEGQQRMLQDDIAYSTIDDTVTQDDHTYANVGSFHRVVNVKFGKPALSTSLVGAK